MSSNGEINTHSHVPPFFIVGCERSGTTLLRTMLNQHSRLFIPTESHFIRHLLEEFNNKKSLDEAAVETAFDIIRGVRRWRDWGDSESSLRSALCGLKQPDLAQIIESVFRLRITKEAKIRWGDKTPNYVRIIPELNDMFPDAKFIHLVRDGRDVCISYLERKWLGDWVEKIAAHWIETVEFAQAAGASLGPDRFLEIRYEDLVLNTKATLQTVCEFLDEPYDSRMLEFYQDTSPQVVESEVRIHTKLNRPPSELDVARWRRELRRLDRMIFEAYALRPLCTFDYVVDYLPIKQFVLYPTLRAIIAFLSKTAFLRQRVGLTKSFFGK